MGNKNSALTVNVVTIGIIILVVLFFLWPRGGGDILPPEPTPSPSPSPVPSPTQVPSSFGWSLTPNMTVVRGQPFQVSLVSLLTSNNNESTSGRSDCTFSIAGWTNLFSNFEVKFSGSNQFEEVADTQNMVTQGNFVAEPLLFNVPQTWIFKGVVLSSISPGIYQICPFMYFNGLENGLFGGWGGERLDNFFVRVI